MIVTTEEDPILIFWRCKNKWRNYGKCFRSSTATPFHKSWI